MAVTEQQFERYIDMMEKAIRDGSLGGGGTRQTRIPDNRTAARTAAEELKLEKARQKQLEENTKVFSSFNKSMKKFKGDFDTYSHLISKSFNETIDSLDYNALEKFPKALEKQLKESSHFTTQTINNLDDAISFFNKIAEQKELVAAMEEFRVAANNGTTVSTETTQLLTDAARKLGISFDKLLASEDKYRAAVNEATKIQLEMTEQARGGWMKNMAERGKALNQKFDTLKLIAGKLADAFENVATPALKVGIGIEDILTSFMAGMNPQELAQNTAQYRQSIRAAGISIDEFRNITESGTLELTQYTGSIADAVKLQSSAFEAAKRMGISADNMRGFMDQQVTTFQKFNKVFGVTAEEFMSLNKQIRDSSEINANMYKLNQQQRAQTHLDIQQTVLRLRTMGLLQEQAMKVVEAMSAIAAKSPKERLKQAARLQAVGGALGFGGEAATAAEIMRRGFNQQGDRERFAELQQTMQQRSGAFMQQGLPQEMMAMQMFQKTGLEDMLGPKSEFASLNQQQFQTTKNIEELAIQDNEFAGKTLGVLQMIHSFLGGTFTKSIGSIIGLLSSIAAGKLLKGAASAMLGRTVTTAMGGGLIRGVLLNAVKLLGPLGIVASLAAMVAPALAQAQDRGKGFEHQAEESWMEKTWREITGKERNRQDTERESALKEQANLIAKQFQTMSGNAESELMKFLPEITQAARTQQVRLKGKMTQDQIKIFENGEWSSITRKSLEGFTPGQQARIKSDTRIQLLEEELKNINTKLYNAQEKKDTDQIRILEEQKELMNKWLNEFKEIQKALKDNTYVINDTLKTNDEHQKERDDEALKASKKNTKIIWSRVKPAGS